MVSADPIGAATSAAAGAMCSGSYLTGPGTPYQQLRGRMCPARGHCPPLRRRVLESQVEGGSDRLPLVRIAVEHFSGTLGLIPLR
jgi:hypothetical protein